jgi:hypothetical protein
VTAPTLGEFRIALVPVATIVTPLVGESIEDDDLDIPGIATVVNDAIRVLADALHRPSAPLVLGTKTLHHVLPDLIPPMDRANTGWFFNWAGFQMRPPRVYETIERALRAFNKLGRAVKPAKYVTGSGWRTSTSKLLDNAICSYRGVACSARNSSPLVETPRSSAWCRKEIWRRSVHAVTPTEDWLRAALGGAILRACSDDEVLLCRDASERSVVFRVGRYLAPVVEGRWPGELWVDLEYNRLAGKVKITKAVGGLQNELEEDAAKKRSVLPDLIIHDRNGNTRDHNILVVEAKKHPAGRKAVKFDLQKLHAYKQQLHYQHAVYVELSKGRPRWQWIDTDDDLVQIPALA